ncbi:TOBE domain-containing protein [Campylobacter sp. RM9344]|uniref:TOBE domain-containing protein n=1 Tax=Campylobacter californiensis TaxID=1032243 RepID=A0AAW3ZX74_9BACT|nr:MULTISPECIES: TOBE domain-containing protein [unclassified Campylobacter]MBE2984052.1 TOBE domain-containing protein [Campylobacter sp. RM6883]MBE2987122.1 TOBE domain-containing protein [Campylobacter sp. RM12919]MBE2988373.1 TOBE domain-containing protein [Campylobacter sp. RM12920]MBE2995477.1 TOBE domain-containing protein [Campylobacter sp. RM6913]MBE3029821.1 TOBE domain-containing protein [Campylobacter sp. RM9344]
MIKAKILNITTKNGVSLYKFQAAQICLFMLSLDRIDGVFEGRDVMLNFKSSDVIIATKELEACSVKNKIPALVTKISAGEILSVIHLKFDKFEFESIITAGSCKDLNLKVGERVFAYVKSTSLHISEVI